MSSNRPSIRSILAPTAAKAVTIAGAGVVAAALSLTATAGAATGGTHARSADASSFSFNLVPSSSAVRDRTAARIASLRPVVRR